MSEQVKYGSHVSHRELAKRAAAFAAAIGDIGQPDRCDLCNSLYLVATDICNGMVFRFCRQCRRFRRDDVAAFMNRSNPCTALSCVPVTSALIRG
jgi:hypothetical protein